MTQQKNAQRPLIVGKPALIMVDFQRGGPYVPGTENGISHMDFAEERRRIARTLVAAAREAHIPVIFIQEVHRPDHVDFGRELDGAEDVHCVEGLRSTEIAAEEVDFRPGDYFGLPRLESVQGGVIVQSGRNRRGAV
jgi:nicotinamidase-related amidase